METVIIVAGLSTSVVGSIILLASLAGRKAELIKAFEIHQRQLLIRKRREQEQASPDIEFIEEELDLTPPRQTT